MNATYVLKRHLSPDQHQNVEDAIRIIHDEVRHANIIITGLLDYARVRTPDRHPASLVDLLERILASDWIPQNVSIVRELPKTDAVVHEVDADQLQGAISNIVRNAIDAVHGLENERRRVTIATRLDAQGDAELCVVDLGEGVPEEARERLFDAFVTTKPGGLGLGLAICRSVIEAHGGRVRHEPNAPRGTRFSFALPTVSA